MDKLQAGIPLTTGKFTLIPVEHLFLKTKIESTYDWLVAFKEPYAIIVCDSNGVRALSLKDKPLSLEDLFQTVPDLGALVESLRQKH